MYIIYIIIILYIYIIHISFDLEFYFQKGSDGRPFSSLLQSVHEFIAHTIFVAHVQGIKWKIKDRVIKTQLQNIHKYVYICKYIYVDESYMTHAHKHIHTYHTISEIQRDERRVYDFKERVMNFPSSREFGGYVVIDRLLLYETT